VFGGKDRMSTEALLTALQGIDEAPWADLRSKPIDARGLAMRLRPYGVASKQVRIGAATMKGYERGDLADAWSRYLSLSPIEAETSETPSTGGAGVSLVSDARYETEKRAAGADDALRFD
jgi:hypothetical protein